MSTQTNSARLLAPSAIASKHWWDEIVVPVGPVTLDVLLISDGEALTGLWFGDSHPGTPQSDSWVRDRAPVAGAAEQLAAYAEGDLTEFDLQLRPAGSDFQRAVWQRLLGIPYGVTTSYGKVAAQVGRPNGSRAVGAAVGSNPIAIVIPCHRVIGANGSLTGYGGGLDNKVALLKLEGVSL